MNLVFAWIACFLVGAWVDPPHLFTQTELGDVKVEVDVSKAPVTTANFLKYVDEKGFQGASFYRTVRMDNQPDNDVKIKVIQGGLGRGDHENRLLAIEHETTNRTGLRHEDGVILMARLAPGTASSEFFICVGDQPELDFGGRRNPDGQGFAAFGRVIEEMDVVRKIQQQPADEQSLSPSIGITNVIRVD